MITVLQKPLTLTPSNVEHIYNFSSPNSGNTDFRYVVDVYTDTLTASPTKVSRLLVSPNTYGVGMVNVERIIRNYVQGNAMSDEPQYTSAITTGTTAYGVITNSVYLSNSNAYIGNPAYPQRYHVRDYRLMVGEQWTSGDTTVTYISTASTDPGSTFYAEINAGVGSVVSYFGAGAGVVEGSGLLQGVYWRLRNLGGTYENGSYSTVDGTISYASSPSVGDIMDVEEKYSEIVYQFQRFPAYGIWEGEHWEFIGIDYDNLTGDYDAVLSPPAVRIWPGTSLSQGSYNPYVYNTPYWDTTSPDEQQNFWEVKKYRMSGTTVNEAEPSMFLTTAGDELFRVVDGPSGITTNRARRRKHHPDCPILISWFEGNISQSSDFDFQNPVGCLTKVTSPNSKGPYAGLQEIALEGNTWTGLTPSQDIVKYFNVMLPSLAGGKVGFWTSGDVGDYQYDGYAFSEFFEFYLQDDDCLSDPVHLLFLNRQGVWDTYTFDKRALETKAITRKSYDQGGIRNTSVYTQLSTERRQVIFDQDYVEVMNVSTWYLKDNDKQIVDDIFMSPEVYMIMDHSFVGKQEKTYNPYLLPVTINTNSIEEFKNQYNKIYQYRFSLEYTPINKYKTQG